VAAPSQVYSDNIYYSDEKRANIYLLGGTTPETAQTEQYLLRNEVIGAVQTAQAELDYLIEQARKPAQEGDTDPSELVGCLATARTAIAAYLEKAQPRDVTVAKKLLVAEGISVE
jgi:hypothetical protein